MPKFSKPRSISTPMAQDNPDPQGSTEAVQPVAGATEAAQNFQHLVQLSSEKIDGRQRRITATVQIPQRVESVWQILTDYDALASFIPNLTKSERIAHPDGGIRLEQIGAQCFLNIQFCARVVLDMYERFPHELGFEMVEGDFKLFRGTWRLAYVGSEDQPVTQLSYELLVKPPLAMPVSLIEHHIRANLTDNMMAIRQRALMTAV